MKLIRRTLLGAFLFGSASKVLGADMMNETQFWTIIDLTAKFENDPEKQLESLHAELRKLTSDEIMQFELAFNEMRRRAYSWELWGAAYVLHGGASDDGFEYFMRWLVSKGRAVFENVVADPESLAIILAPEPGGPCEFEEFAYVASKVWQEKTGINPWEDDQGRFPYTGAPPAADPAGTPFKDSEQYLSKAYPKLWERFGHSPLG
jgi:hypothetical protein